jgi:hypothetical protein
MDAVKFPKSRAALAHKTAKQKSAGAYGRGLRKWITRKQRNARGGV